MSTIRDVTPEGKLVENTQIPTEVHATGDVINSVGDLNEISIAQVLDLDGMEAKKEAVKVKTILDWVKTQTDDLSPLNVKWVIRNLEGRLASPAFGETRLKQIYRYVYLELETRKMEAEKQNLLSR